jgi:PIN domain nuclease of toxin-antitoxin system
VKLRLDTHTVLWWLSGDERLGPRAGELIDDASSEVLLSAAVVLEATIKRSLGKLEAPAGLSEILIGAGALPLPRSI